VALEAQDNWQAEHDEAQHLVELATTLGIGTNDTELILQKDETLIGSVQNASLIEEREVGAHFVGGSQAFRSRSDPLVDAASAIALVA